MSSHSTQIHPNVPSAIGGTPLVKLNHVTRGIKATVPAKLEFMNPGGSTKDRVGVAMIEAAEREGNLQPGGTIVQGTSGNTGVALAIAAAVGPETPLGALWEIFSQGMVAVALEENRVEGIVTKIDLIDYLAGRLK